VEIRDPIHGTLIISKNETRVLDSPAFQRLRMIKQLGFSEFSFPGATHSRYIHSLGVSYLAGVAFDFIFKDYEFSSSTKKENFRQILRLGALLHDIGHGPLSHTTEEVMPALSELNVNAYQHLVKTQGQTQLMEDGDRRANHEDYTIKFITDSHLTEILATSFPDFDPYHIACLIDKGLADKDDFFMDQGLNLRVILSQIVSSEVDVDRMDYLLRDAYFCGTSYGKVELNWLLGNFTYHIRNGVVHLALDRRAIYTFDDFLLSRHHMYLMVYFHHKSIIYERNALPLSDLRGL
jgi:HD superfamily phosphohydrolase